MQVAWLRWLPVSLWLLPKDLATNVEDVDIVEGLGVFVNAAEEKDAFEFEVRIWLLPVDFLLKMPGLEQVNVASVQLFQALIVEDLNTLSICHWWRMLQLHILLSPLEVLASRFEVFVDLLPVFSRHYLPLEVFQVALSQIYLYQLVHHLS